MVRSKPCDEEREDEREPSQLLDEISNLREERQITFAAAVQTDNIDRYLEDLERDHRVLVKILQ